MKFRTALLATILTAIVAGSVHAQTLRVTIRKAPIRSGPGSQETLVATAVEGDLLEYIDVEGLWYIVRMPSTQQVGYVHSALVEQTAERAPTTTQPAPARTIAPPPPVAAPMAQPCAPPPPPPSRSSSRTSPPPPPKRELEQLPNTQPSIDPTLDDAPWEHRGFGIGVRMGHSTVGNMAFNLRSFGRGHGLSFDFASDVDVLQLQPSLMFKIGSPIELEAVYFQPYFGVGANAFWHRIENPDTTFDVGVVALGGMDLGFTAVPNLTVSVDLGYFSDPIDSNCRGDCFTSSFSNRLGLNFGVDWYFK